MTDPPPADRDLQAQDYGELWLSEMWPAVPQYHPPAPKALPARLRRRRLSMPPAPAPSPNGDA